MPAARDEELAVIFREMRRASERSLEVLAERLKTTPALLVALESGEIAALPEWDETSRVVNEYTGLLRLDGRPVLRRLEKRFTTREPSGAKPVAAAASPPAQARTIPATAAATRAAPPLPPKAVKGPPMPPGARVRTAMPPPAAPRSGPQSRARVPTPVAAGPAVAPPPGRTAEAPRHQPREAPERTPVKVGRSRKGKFVTWALLLAVFGAMALGVRHAIQHPAAVWSTVDSLPEPAPQVVRSVWELVRPFKDASPPAPAADPQSQKADRLPDTGPAQGN